MSNKKGKEKEKEKVGRARFQDGEDRPGDLNNWGDGSIFEASKVKPRTEPSINKNACYQSKFNSTVSSSFCDCYLETGLEKKK